MIPDHLTHIFWPSYIPRSQLFVWLNWGSVEQLFAEIDLLVYWCDEMCHILLEFRKHIWHLFWLDMRCGFWRAIECWVALQWVQNTHPTNLHHEARRLVQVWLDWCCWRLMGNWIHYWVKFFKLLPNFLFQHKLVLVMSSHMC